MKYAFVNGQRAEASPNTKAICPTCGGNVIAKCGSFRVHHWAHQGNRDCDPWAEGETEWHRAWKNRFPSECQEIIRYDEKTGEKHVADVCINNEFVVEFQHSHLRPTERMAREGFYGNMVWIVDGTRLKKDYPRFFEGMKACKNTHKEGVYLLPNPERSFPVTWLECKVPVLFDFLSDNAVEEPENTVRQKLWCLLPVRIEGQAVVVRVSREYFVELASRGSASFMGGWREVVRSLVNGGQQPMQMVNVTSLLYLMQHAQGQGPVSYGRRRSRRF